MAELRTSFWLKCVCVLVFGILGINSGSDPFSQQPRIVVEDGHLTFRSANNRNINLVSSDQGKVQINNVDIAGIISQGSGSSQSINEAFLRALRNEMSSQWRSDLVGQVNQLEENVTDIAQKVNRLTGSDQNRITNRGIRRYFARVKALEDKVTHLTELLSTNECTSNPCRNGGTCVDTYNGFVCKCPSNWDGPHCDSDVNECAIYSGTAFGCQNGATCINLQGSYRCECATNWYGIHCSEQHDDCSSASHQELCGHGTCINEIRVIPGRPKYRCICDPGWRTATGSLECTQDIDECEGREIKCSTNPRVMCINLPGTFHCGPCPAGYTGNGLYCADINECENQNGGCSVNPFVECYNTPGSRRCGPCPAGYFGNGEQCMFQSVCNNNRGGCHPLAMCIDNPAITATYRECRCPPGYIGNGEGLTGCTLGQGMTCANNPCQHGTCQMSGQSYHCVCEAGYFGTNCEQEEDSCWSTPCQNGGTCIRGRGSFSCTCPEGYSGITCSEANRVCGGYLNGDNGTLHYPPYDGNYDHRANCAWVITVGAGKVVNVTFDHFQLEGGISCEFDFLQLNDGPTAASRAIGRFCSNQLHGETFSSTHNQVYLWFRSDHSVSASGFTISWKADSPSCGGVLNVSEYGAIRSPGYPGTYPVNRTCSWLVQVPIGKRIQFSFATLMLEHHPNCSFDYLKIFDGANERDPLIGTYCTMVTPPPLTTSGHVATLVFHSDASVQDNGFNIAYSSVPAIQGCGGIITRPQGSVQSPNFPNVYEQNMLCEWIIRIHPDNRIKISFTDFHLEAHANCNFDSLEIYDGPSDDAPLLSRYCGTTLPPEVLSNSNQVYVRFKTDMSAQFPGFKLDYKTICGGVFTELTGILTSPYYPENYPASSTCLYEIRLPQGYIVNFTIHTIDIEPHVDCHFDYLQIRDGDSENAREVALLCGDSARESIVSTYNVLWMKFQTDGSVQNRGFRAQYDAIEIGCGGVMTEDNGQIMSPRHPNTYPHNTTCTWLIRAPESHIIKLSFSSFLLEATRDCKYDYVLIEDGNGIQMGKYCGSTKPPVVTSMDNTLLVKFVADESVSREGFIASYQFLDALEACGGDFYQESGVIRSPGYPNFYPHQAHCIWVLHAENGRQIALNITDFKLENHADCKFDYLGIRNGGYETSPLIGKYCDDQTTSPIRSHSSLLRLEFRTDSSQSEKGFEIYFDSTAVGCGGRLTTSRGSIVSPNYPQPYPLNADCEWLIQVSEGSVISLALVEIDIEEHDACQFDYLQIFDGDSENSKSLMRICNNQQIPGQILSTGNSLLLRFRSDFSHEAGGFHLTYQTLCNSILTKRRGVIESPNFPNSYPHNHNCSWTIEAPPGSNISISFSHLFIEGNDNCTLDYVEVFENRSGELQSRGKFCGDMHVPPKTIYIGINSAVVRLVTDRSVSKEGFRLEYSMHGCGGDVFGKPHGVIESPNYPFGYPVNTVCYWHIWYPPGSRVEFTLEDLDIEAHSNCEFDFLRVYGGEDVHAPRLLNACHTYSNVTVITSPGNEIFIHFHSDNTVAQKGFFASFKKLENGCGGRFSLDHGIIRSPNFPLPYSANDTCEWLIEVSETSLVILEFYDFEMPVTTDCSQGHVAIYDGSNTSAPLLLNHCGAKPENPIMSTSNKMLVKLVADGINVAKGFRANFKEGCGRRLVADLGGEIRSPNYPEVSLRTENCSWIIYTPQIGEKISLTVTTLMIPDSGNCSYSSLLVFDGDMEDSPRTAQLCGQRVPPPMVSRGSVMHVFLKNRGIFRATYGLLSEHCGGSYQSPEGSFASPGYPTNYDMNMECVWTIEASPGNKVQLSFQSFHIEDSEFCNSDYLEIHESNASGHLIGKYCGNNIPNNVTASKTLWIKFRSDEIGTAPGFMAHYDVVHDSVQNGTSGYISSPGYPQRYRLRGDYTWTIIVSRYMYISIQFLDFGVPGGQGTCYASLQIFDGPNVDSPLIGQYCGYQIPDPIISTTNVVTIRTNLGYTSSLFYLQWSAVTHSGAFSRLDSSGNCFKEFSVNSTNRTMITSPGYPGLYPNLMNCTYLIRTSSSDRLVLNVVRFEMEGYMPVCNYDKMESYYAPNPNVDAWVLNSTYCGYTSPFQLSSPNNLLKLIFKSDRSGSYYGMLGYTSTACGGHLYERFGVLRSSAIATYLQKLNGTNTLRCEWVISVKQRRTVRLTFDNFNIEDDVTCNSNYILFRNGAFSTSPLLGSGRLCGSSPPTIPESSANEVHVEIVYNAASRRSFVFDLRYEELAVGCGGRKYLNHDIPFVEISSPNYLNPPTTNIECDWVIVSPSGSRMRIDFEQEFNLVPYCYGEGDAKIEYLQLHDGGSENSEVLRRFCGNDQPSSVLTTGNALFARYLTTVDHPQAGFKATVRIAQCGGTVLSWNEVIQSPNFPQNYGSSIECEWFLKMRYDYHMTLNVTDFQTPSSDNCSTTDYLEIRQMSPEGDIGEVLRTLCGTPTLPLVIDVPSPFAYVKFKSNTAVTAKGFSMTMKTQFEEGCGGSISEPSGVLTSPRYPNAIAARRGCFWKIDVPEGRAIKVTFDALNLPFDEELNKCESFVSVFNITHRRGRRQDFSNQLCGNILPQPIVSSGSVLYINFETVGLSAGQGFSLRYSTDEAANCGGLLTGPSGSFESTNFTVQADSYVDCRWRIDTGENKTLTYKFEYLDLPGNRANYCRDGSLYMSSSNRYIGSICGNHSNSLTFTSGYSTINLRLIASLEKQFRGFRGTYNTSDCGGYLDGSNTIITSPGYPTGYPAKTNCHWILTVPEGEIIRLSAEDMRLEEDCLKDSVMVKNGIYLDSPVVGKFCGNQNPVPIVSSGNTLSVIFKSDEFGTAPGFKFHTTEVQRGCGGLTHQLKGNFSSPNFPSRYDNNVECVWIIELAAGNLVKLEFIGRFDIETDVDCARDYLMIEDFENNGTWSLREKKCGSTTTPTLVSKSNKLRITFHSNERVVGDGFNLEYSAACGGNFTAPSGDIYSPNYPSLYSDSLNCTYFIGKQGDYVSIRFDDFSIEGVEECIYDYVEIFQISEQSYYNQGKFCGTASPTERSLQGPVIIRFVTDYSYTAHGFKLHYDITSCNTVLTNPSGVISSPTLTDVRFIIRCTWQITVAEPDKVIAIRFLNFDIKRYYDCWASYLIIRDGNETAPLIGRLCGNNVEQIIKSTGSQLYLRFENYYSEINSGFSLYYYTTYGSAAGCGGILNITDNTFISSLDQDSDGFYEPNLDCGWTILTNISDQAIKMTFTKFDLEDPRNGSCTEDYVEIRDSGSGGMLIGRYCGSSVPLPVISSENQIFVHFHSNGEVNKAGFKIVFNVVPSPCGQSSLTSSSEHQVLTSPNYPNPYPINLRCTWKVFRNSTLSYRSFSIEIVVTDLDIPCGNDYLEIRNSQEYGSRAVPNPHRICGTEKPPAIKFSSGLSLIFHSDSVANSGVRGFSLTYRDATCSNNYSADSGVLTNNGYPVSYYWPNTCQINITVSEGKTISLYFKSFQMVNSVNCSTSSMKVYDGNTTTSPLLANYCGYSVPVPVFSNGRSLLIDVKSGYYNVLFYITYMATDKGRGCGGNISAVEGVISSPLYPEPYNVHPRECVWYISVPGYHTVKTEFKAFSLNSSRGCDSNYVEIFDGSSDTSSRIARYCGEDQPADHESRGSQVTVKFVTDSTNNQPGFLLSFSSSYSVVEPSTALLQRNNIGN